MKTSRVAFSATSLQSEQVKNPGNKNVFNSTLIQRRGVVSGNIKLSEKPSSPTVPVITTAWQNNQPVYLPEFLTSYLSDVSVEINQSRELYECLLNQNGIEDRLDSEPYISVFNKRFEILSSRFDEADQQEIITVDFDVMDGDTLLLEDIWMRVSWLSFEDDDESLRFRFSFGMENYEDVSQDPERQLAAAELSQCVFPESRIITENQKLDALLKEVLSLQQFNFVERIIYYNSPNGGAQFHHDAEKGHLGVVYAQLTGETFWLSLSRDELEKEIQQFVQNDESCKALKTLIADSSIADEFITGIRNSTTLQSMLDDPEHNEMSLLLNQSSEFFQQLLTNQHGFALTAGDVILLPQASMQACAWHSVFCLGNETGEALSFAIKPM